jgi:hypothetical protein
VGGFWMTDANFKATLYLGNSMKTDPVTVTPILHLSNGVQYVLSPVTLEPSGTALVNINQALAKQGIAPYATLSGYVEIQYQWPWAPICAPVWDVDTVAATARSCGTWLDGREPTDANSRRHVVEAREQRNGIPGAVQRNREADQGHGAGRG